MTRYCFCSNGCKVETYDKNQIDENFLRYKKLTKAEYDALATLDNGTLYIITDEPNAYKRLEDIEKRLDELGFKEGTFTIEGGGAVVQNTITKQGKRIIGNLSMISSIGFTAPTIRVPDEFKPSTNTSILVGYLTQATISVYSYVTATLNVDGTITGLNSGNMLQMHITNAGWEIA